MKFQRVLLVVANGCGVGELPDAGRFGDAGAATIPHVASAAGGVYMYTLGNLGLGNITTIEGVPPAENPGACFGRMAEKSVGKDSTSGHWEMGGVVVDTPLPSFPDGLPADLITQIEQAADVKIIGNVVCPANEVISKFGADHMASGAVILWLSTDSILQIAAHETIYSPDRLYEICQIARTLLTGDYGVPRLISRPFQDRMGLFQFNAANRRDFSLAAPSDTILDLAASSGLKALAIGKVFDLFAGRGFDDQVNPRNNREVISSLIHAAESGQHELVFANFADFDTLWGHTNQEINFAKGLEDFDEMIENLLPALRDDDLLMITADHGCDPTIKNSTDHSREYVPLLVWGKQISGGVDLGSRETFADIAATIADNFDLQHSFPARSFLQLIR